MEPLQFVAITPLWVRIVAFYALAGVIIGVVTKGWQATVKDCLLWPLTVYGLISKLWTKG